MSFASCRLTEPTALVLLLLTASCNADPGQGARQSSGITDEFADAYALLDSNGIATDALRVSRVVNDEIETVIWAQQLFNGMPIFFADIAYAFDESGALEIFPGYSGGKFLPTSNPPIDPASVEIKLPPLVDERRARQTMLKLYPELNAEAIQAELGLFDPETFRRSPVLGPFSLVWRVSAMASGYPFAIIDAGSGEVLFGDDGVRTSVPVIAEDRADPDCGRSLCGCWSTIKRTLELKVNDSSDGAPLSGIEVRCDKLSSLIAVSDLNGAVATTVDLEVSPGCGLGKCRELVLTDPSGRFGSQSIAFPNGSANVNLQEN